MATSNINANMTALEVARRSSNPDQWFIIETMSQSNTMYQELPITEANQGTTHTFLQRTTYPEGTYRLYDEGVSGDYSNTKPVTEYTCMADAYSKVDQRKAEHSGNPSQLYLSEATAWLMGMGRQMAELSIYGNRNANPRVIDGLGTRLNRIGDFQSGHCVDAGLSGTGSNLTSIFIVAGGLKACHYIYPQGASGIGVQREDLGIQLVTADNGGDLKAHVDHFYCEWGLAVEHPDAVIRICNIPATLTKDLRAQLVDTILQMQQKIVQGNVSVSLYCNQSMAYQIQKAARELQYVVFPETDPWGRPVDTINGMRVRRMDVIVNTEDQVVR
jgi:hypothetical protein